MWNILVGLMEKKQGEMIQEVSHVGYSQVSYTCGHHFLLWISSCLKHIL